MRRGRVVDALQLSGGAGGDRRRVPLAVASTRQRPARTRRLLRFALVNVVIVLAFLPWLPTAIERILNWPKGGVNPGLWASAQMALATLVFGPLRHLPTPAWPWLLAAGVLPVAGIVAHRREDAAVPLALWLYAPAALLFGLGLFSPRFSNSYSAHRLHGA